MQRLFAIAKLTLKAALRYRLVQVLTVLLLGAVIGLPVIIRPAYILGGKGTGIAGTAEDFRRMAAVAAPGEFRAARNSGLSRY